MPSPCPTGTLTPLASDGSEAAGGATLTLASWASVVSPDGRWLAGSTGSDFHLYQLNPTIAEVAVDGLTPRAGFWPPLWSLDSAHLFGFSGGSELVRPDLAAHHARRLTTVHLVPYTSPVITPDGAALYLLAQELAPAGSWPPVRGDPYLVAVAAGSGAELGRIRLPGLRAGEHFGATPADGSDANYAPALAVAPDGRHLYIAHAESDQLTVLRLPELTIERTVDLAGHPAPVSRFVSALLDHLAGRAEAKGGSLYRRRLQVAPDGRYLYLSGVQDSGAGVPPNARQPLGLTIVDTSTWRVVGRQAGVEDFVLSGDGTRLLTTGWALDYDALGGGAYRAVNRLGSGALVLDARTGAVVAPVADGRLVREVALSPDGRRALFLSTSADWEPPVNGGGCATARWQLTAVDVASGAVVMQRDLFWSRPELLAPLRTPMSL